MLKNTEVIVFSLLAFFCNQWVTSKWIEDKGTYLLECEQEPMELGIVMDSSSSIRRSDFEKGKKFLQNFLNQFAIGNGKHGVRVSIITFGRGIYPWDGFNLDTYDNKEAILQAIGRIPHRAGTFTDTGKGIEYMDKQQMIPRVVRPYAEKVGLVITDGNSQIWKFTAKAAADARANNITMYAIGIGNKHYVKEAELLRIAGDRKRVTRVESYSSLSTIKQLLAKKICIKKPKPTTTTTTTTNTTTTPTTTTTTTTPPPKTTPPIPINLQSCAEEFPSDINFVFSPGDLGFDGVGFATSFISHTIDDNDLKEGFRYGLVTGMCPNDAGFSLDEYNSVTEIREHLTRYNRTHLLSLIQRVAQDGFSVESGGRDDARKVAVLIHDDAGEVSRSLADLQKAVKSLVDTGVEVFIASPSGTKTEIEGALSLVTEGLGGAHSQSAIFKSALCTNVTVNYF